MDIYPYFKTEVSSLSKRVELLPCPFCGNKPDLQGYITRLTSSYQRYSISIKCCSVHVFFDSGELGDFHKSATQQQYYAKSLIRDAVYSWNKRYLNKTFTKGEMLFPNKDNG